GLYKTLGMIFMNPSLRTRLSTQKAGDSLGMNVMVMNVAQDGWNLETGDGVVMDGDAQEHIKEAARVISQYCDIIALRSFARLKDQEEDRSEAFLTRFVQEATVPVVNMESATGHPLQALADLMTIEEHRSTTTPRVVLTWAPHPRALPQAVPNSFAQWVGRSDAELIITHPEGYSLDPEFTSGATFEPDQNRALEGADFVYAKNWSSTTPYGEVLTTDRDWMITEEKMSLTNQGKFMHCLPVRRNVIVTDEVLDSPTSIVIEQAANREFATQAVLKRVLEWID
ncbi:MAG: N-acetylornithine carbamoyltransferase, partial [Candidatus Kapaibacterium sp.]